MITPNESSAPTSASEMAVPLELLSVDGVAPAAGDETEVPVRVRIARVEGKQAFVTPVAINGQELPAAATPSEPTDDDMMKLAQEADDEERL